MRQYHQLLNDILRDGVTKAPARSGMPATKALFGYQMRFDLQEGFPLMTTKKMHLKSVIHELLFFLKGDTNIRYLNDNGVRIWNEWADENGNLGPIYSHQWTKWGASHANRPQPKPALHKDYSPTVFGVGSAGSYTKGASDIEDNIFIIWKGMLARCYNPKKDTYAKYYGGKGVHVSNDWLLFDNFSRDVKLLEGWTKKLNDWDNIHLDKDTVGNGFRYAMDTCIWLSRLDNMKAKYTTRYTVKHDDGRTAVFYCAADFIRDNKVAQGNFNAMLRGDRPKAGGWSLLSAVNTTEGINQIKNVVERLKTNPECRRLIVSAWNVDDLQHMALAPCHALFQFNCREINITERMSIWESKHKLDFINFHFPSDEGATRVNIMRTLDDLEIPKYKLDCQLYQRSADTLLGVPFNIASYSLLTMMIAQCVNMIPGDFIHSFGDVHIYEDHMEQVKTQLERTPMKLPIMKINPNIKDIFDFSYDDFEIIDYNPYPAIKAPVAV